MRKLLDISLAKKYGWKYKTSLKKGLSITINDFLKKTNAIYNNQFFVPLTGVEPVSNP